MHVCQPINEPTDRLAGTPRSGLATPPSAHTYSSINIAQGTRFLVDGFNYTDPRKCQHYFLTHFHRSVGWVGRKKESKAASRNSTPPPPCKLTHSDHTWGLRPSFAAGTIYCSEPTAALLVGKLGVHAQFVEALPMRTPRWIQVRVCASWCVCVLGVGGGVHEVYVFVCVDVARWSCESTTTPARPPSLSTCTT